MNVMNINIIANVYYTQYYWYLHTIVIYLFILIWYFTLNIFQFFQSLGNAFPCYTIIVKILWDVNNIQYNLFLIIDWQKYSELFIYVFFVWYKIFEVLTIKYSSKKYIGNNSCTCCEPAVILVIVWNIEKWQK